MIRAGLQQRKRELIERRDRVEADLAHNAEPLTPDFADAAIQVENDEVLAAIDRAAETEVAEIDEALDRLDGGMYGLCKLCGGPIEVDLLSAIPQAVTCRCDNSIGTDSSI